MTIQAGPGRPPLISVESIVAAGCALGLPALSLTAVADRLGVAVSALYRHVKGRDDLARRVAEQLVSEFEMPVGGIAARSDLYEFGTRLYRFLGRHPGLSAYVEVSPPPSYQSKAEQLIAVIAGHGYPPAVAALACWDVQAFVATYVAAEARAASNRTPGEATDGAVSAGSGTSEPETVHVAASRLRQALAQTTASEVFDWTLRFHVEGLLGAIDCGDLPWQPKTDHR